MDIGYGYLEPLKWYINTQV